LKEKPVVVIKNGLVPVPEGWDLKSVLKTLKSVGHEIQEVREKSGVLIEPQKKDKGVEGGA